MKTLFIPAKIRKINFKKINFKILPERISLASTVQYFHFLNEIKKFLNKKGKKITQKFKILGCSKINSHDEEAFLYIGTGKFHPIQISLQTSLPVFIFNPESGKTFKLNRKEIKKFLRAKNLAKKKFLLSKNIGILISIKPGQENLKKALEFKKEIEKKFPKKKFFLFLADKIEVLETENFPQIECWVNTACPRIFDDFLYEKKEIIINLDDLNILKYIIQKRKV